MPTAGHGDRAAAIGAALSAAANRDDPWPEHLELYDVFEELSHWLEDDRQWSQSRGGHWQSLLEDIEDSLMRLGDATSDLLNASELARQFKACRAMFDPKKPPSDLALRRRLARLADEMVLRLQPSLLLAAWRDLLSALDQGRDPEEPAAHLLSIAAWLGYSPESLRRDIEGELFDGRTPVIDGKPRFDESHASRSIEARLDAVAKRLDEPAPRGKAVVWLRYQLAKVDWEQGGFPIIAFGDAIAIYQGEWLRACVLHEQPDRGLPAETIGPDAWALRMFLGLPAHGVEAEPEPEPPEQPTAYVRVDVGDQVLGRAVDIARSNAEALAAIGTLYGANPTLWSLDESNVVFINGRDAGSLAAPLSIAEPTYEQRIAVHEDRTCRDLRDMASKLTAHLPIRDAELQRATTLLAWLRGARSAPSALKLVLCDRVVESVAGWAGIARPEQFVRTHLLPWWAYSRMRARVTDVAYSLWHSRGAPNNDSDAIWEEIKNHPPLQIRPYPDATMSLRGVLSETQWLLKRVPAESSAGQRLVELDQLTRTGAAAATWWTRLCKQGASLEKRRFRTRNALMHGGPLAPGIVEAVAPFAENLASEALSASIEGRLLVGDLVDYFLDRETHISKMRMRLTAGDAPSDVMFSEWG